MAAAATTGPGPGPRSACTGGPRAPRGLPAYHPPPPVDAPRREAGVGPPPGRGRRLLLPGGPRPPPGPVLSPPRSRSRPAAAVAPARGRAGPNRSPPIGWALSRDGRAVLRAAAASPRPRDGRARPARGGWERVSAARAGATPTAPQGAEAPRPPARPPPPPPPALPRASATPGAERLSAAAAGAAAAASPRAGGKGRGGEGRAAPGRPPGSGSSVQPARPEETLPQRWGSTAARGAGGGGVHRGLSLPRASRTGEAAAAGGARRVQPIVNLARRGGAGEASPSPGVAVAAAAALGALRRGRGSVGRTRPDGGTPPLKSVWRLSASGLRESARTSTLGSLVPAAGGVCSQ
ncbi:uncharacterized protein ACIBXB_018934 [Morphnus guianensis]